MKIAQPRYSQAIIHDVPPGESPDALFDQLRRAKLPLRDIGFEVDVANKRLPEGKFVPCCVSRDRRLFIPIRQHLKTFRDAGFEGPNIIDLTCRRSVAPVINELAENANGTFSESLVQVPLLALGFKTPAQEKYFQIDDPWKSAWPRLLISSRFPALIQEFLCEGVRPVVFYEPIPSDEYRQKLIPILKEVDRIIYKMPQLNYDALFDLDSCYQGDSLFLAEILKGKGTSVVPMGSVDILRNVQIL